MIPSRKSVSDHFSSFMKTFLESKLIYRILDRKYSFTIGQRGNILHETYWFHSSSFNSFTRKVMRCLWLINFNNNSSSFHIAHEGWQYQTIECFLLDYLVSIMFDVFTFVVVWEALNI